MGLGVDALLDRRRQRPLTRHPPPPSGPAAPTGRHGRSDAPLPRQRDGADTRRRSRRVCRTGDTPARTEPDIGTGTGTYSVTPVRCGRRRRRRSRGHRRHFERRGRRGRRRPEGGEHSAEEGDDRGPELLGLVGGHGPSLSHRVAVGRSTYLSHDVYASREPGERRRPRADLPMNTTRTAHLHWRPHRTGPLAAAAPPRPPGPSPSSRSPLAPRIAAGGRGFGQWGQGMKAPRAAPLPQRPRSDPAHVVSQGPSGRCLHAEPPGAEETP